MDNKNNIRKLTRAGILLAFAFVVIFTGSRFGGAVFNQIVIGPLVNAVIISTVLICDIKFGILLGILTPIIAGFTGQLAQPMLPFSPFIMFGNAVLALVFGLSIKYIKSFGIYIGILAGAVLKTFVLALSAKYLVALFKVNLPQPILAKLVIMMSYPQLYSAVGGGVVALLLYSVFKRYAQKEE